jgi:UDP-glucose:(heptosyl)LPS alpha-1,3-glucosyltransferase
MRIAFVVHDFMRAVGHGRYAVELARRFDRDHEVHVFANRADAMDTGGLRVHHVPAIRANALSTVATFTIPATLRVGRGWDVVHAQGACCLRFNVITAHICNAGWARAQANALVARTWRQRTFERVVTPFERTVFRRSRAAEAIAISDQLRRELAEHYGRTERVTVIHHGVDLDHFAPAPDREARDALRRELGVAPGSFVTLFIGDLRKGGAAALDVIASAPGARLLTVSRSDPGPYLSRARALGVADRVAFHPSSPRIERYYAAADVFLFPSPYDAFGMVIAEAMSSALPVITTRMAGAAEWIEDGASGFVVDRPSDIGRMAALLERLMVDARLRESIGTAARMVAGRHSWDAVARRTMEVYQRTTPLR